MGVNVGVKVAVAVAVGEGVHVAVGVLVAVGLDVLVKVAVAVADGVYVRVGGGVSDGADGVLVAKMSAGNAGRGVLVANWSRGGKVLDCANTDGTTSKSPTILDKQAKIKRVVKRINASLMRCFRIS